MADRLERRKEHLALLDRIDRQNWHLWVLSFGTTLCLALAIASLFYPAIRWHVDRLEALYGILPQLIVGLLTLILLCIIYITLKQRELNELRMFLVATHLEARRLREELPKDTLTGVLDRRALPEVLKREVTWVDRYRVPLSLLLFNVRGLRDINDREGNLAGDEILKELAKTLEATARQTDTILRYGPDRFLCFLPRTDTHGAQAFARRVNEGCHQNPRLRDLSLCFGIALYSPGGGSDKILAEVERAMSKMAGAGSHLSSPAAIVQPR
jgi:diguanylate cyclase (GGDEF)-like protein